VQSPFANLLHRRARFGLFLLIAAGGTILGLLSRGLDRPATTAHLSVEASDEIGQVDSQMLPGPGVLTRVWLVKPHPAGSARISFGALPAQAALAVALAARTMNPMHLTVTAADHTVSRQIEVPPLAARWQVVALPVLTPGPGKVVIEFGATNPTETIRVTEPFFTDGAHSSSARIVGRLATALLALTWLVLLATAAVSFWLQPAECGLTQPVFRGYCLIAGTGYLAFWSYLASPRLGDAYVGLLTVGLLIWLGSARGATAALALWRDERWWRVWLAAAGVGLVYFSLLHLRECDAAWSWMAANRYRPGLPADNEIPQMFARRLLEGQSPRHLIGDWLSSDRPPMQTGVILLLDPLLRLTDGHLFDSLCQATGFWFQLLWVPALAGLLQSLGLPLRRALALVACIAATAVLLMNTQFVWPKLAAAGFVLGAWVLWHDAAPRRCVDWGWTGGALALGFLCHGGVAFSLLALGPMMIWGGDRTRWCGLARCALVAACIYAPWWAYQHFYEPPGNRLLKWYLAGVIPPDGRSTAEALYDAYHTTSMPIFLEGRRANLQALITGNWRDLADFSTRNPDQRFNDDFFAFFRSLGWWNLGLVALPFAWWRARRHGNRIQANLLGSILGWSAATLALWVLLLFQPYSTVIHQGSYVPILLLVGASAWSLYTLHPTMLAVVSAYAGAYFAVAYAWAMPAALPTAVAAAALIPLAIGSMAMIVAAAGWRRRQIEP